MRIVLAYSGSLDGSAAIQWLRERHAAEIVAVTLDLGQGRELEAVRDRALAIGAQRAHVLDARDAFARAHGLGSGVDDEARDERNFWGRSVRRHGGDAASDGLAAAPETYPGEPAFVDVAFSHGVPTALNGVPLPLLELVASLGTLTAAHGVGRGAAGPLWCDAAAAVLLHAARRELTHAASADNLRAFSDDATARYVQLVEDARWFSPLREGLDAYFSSVQSHVNGHVRLRMFRGEHSTISTELSEPLAHQALAPVVPSSAQH